MKCPLDSPPLTRGIPHRRGYAPDSARLTPAYAGNAILDIGACISSPTHPRLRGEYKLELGARIRASDSPPLTRGIHARCADSRSPSGTHPRWRGEYSICSRSARPLMDSPPLMRGMRASAVACTRTPRLTPANAGNTRPAGQRSLFPVTHPRLRGEYPVGFPSLHSSSDSPPLARGTQQMT